VNERTIEGRRCGTYNIGLYRLDGGHVDDLELFCLCEAEGDEVFRETLDALRHLQACGLIVGSEGLDGLVCSTLETVSSWE
jgi:hypothetical protein